MQFRLTLHQLLLTNTGQLSPLILQRRALMEGRVSFKDSPNETRLSIQTSHVHWERPTIWDMIPRLTCTILRTNKGIYCLAWALLN